MSNCDSHKLSGFIKQDETIFAFICENFQFTIIVTDRPSPFEFHTLKISRNGFLFGETGNGNDIAIYCGKGSKDIKISHSLVINTDLYIVLNKRFKGFRTIRFVNGSIRSVHWRNSLHLDSEAEQLLNNTIRHSNQNYNDTPQKRYLVYSLQDDSTSFSIKVKNTLSVWKFHSAIKQQSVLSEGEQLSNDQSLLDITFNENQELETFPRYYGYVSSIISFLTFRKSAYYDRLELLNSDQGETLRKVADCYIKKTSNIAAREAWKSLTVDKISSDTFQNIVTCETQKEYQMTDDTAYLPLLILPNDYRDFSSITPSKIRDICSELEQEIAASNIVCSDTEALIDLKKSVKYLVKNHKNNIKDGTFNLINSSISHWGDTASDKAVIAWKSVKEVISPIMQRMKIEADEESIRQLIRTRNNIVHSGLRTISQSDAQAAVCMTVVCYCLALKRVGVDNRSILELMNRGII